MIKALDSNYVPGERKNKWLKLKPEYIDGLGDDLDLLIVGTSPRYRAKKLVLKRICGCAGGYYGTGIGRRGGSISHFMLGLAVKNERDDPKNPKL